MTVGRRTDPYLAFTYLVEKKGAVVGGFSEVSGLQVEIETADYRQGGENDFIYKLAGPVRYPSNLTLKRGIVTDKSLWEWFRDVSDGKIECENISVILLDTAGEEVRRWNFKFAYPVKWVGPSLNATSDAVAVETFEFVHRGFDMV